MEVLLENAQSLLQGDGWKLIVMWVIGAVLIYEGLSDLWTIFRVSQWTKEYRKHHPVDVDQIDFE